MLYKRTSVTTTSTRAKNKKGPKPREHVQLFRLKRDHNKAFYSEKCYLEASIALYFEWLGNLCLGMCYRRFTILSRAPNAVSNDHSCSDRSS